MSLREKLILVDCDGVLVDWLYAFDGWMARHGHRKVHSNEYNLSLCYNLEKWEVEKLISIFNESATIEYLPPFRDAIKYVKKLHEEHGYVFHCITSLSLDPFAKKAREKNLENLFGKTVFERVVCLDTGADKDEVLAEYFKSECFWIEDKPENAIAGGHLGLTPILVAHDHNVEFKHYDIPRVQNWKEIHDIVLAYK